MKHWFGRTTVAWLFVASSLLVAACSSPVESGKDEGGNTAIPSAELCAAQYDAMEKSCPTGNDKDREVAFCKGDQQDYAGEGCQDEYDAWLQCTTGSGYHCQDDTGCETAQAGYSTCQSQAVQRTGCVRLGPQDATRCSDASKPYAFGCLGKAPAVCTQVVFEGAGIWCCPQI